MFIEYLIYQGVTANESLRILQSDDGWNSYFCERKFSKPSDIVADKVSNRMEIATKFTLYKYNSAEPFQVVLFIFYYIAFLKEIIRRSSILFYN